MPIYELKALPQASDPSTRPLTETFEAADDGNALAYMHETAVGLREQVWLYRQGEDRPMASADGLA
jgi:hypothetical protein